MERKSKRIKSNKYKIKKIIIKKSCEIIEHGINEIIDIIRDAVH
jgi:hypothetical protein